MRRYRIRCLDSDGAIARTHDVHCRDDLDALAEGERLCEKNPVEVWEGSRLVARVKAGNTALSSQDLHSL